jgi:hypothetical protein
VENGSGTRTCPRSGIFTVCLPESCDQGYQLNAGQCNLVDEEYSDSSAVTGTDEFWTPAIIGGIVGGGVLLIAGAIIAFFVVRKRRQHSYPMESSNNSVQLREPIAKTNSTAHLLASTPSTTNLFQPAASPYPPSPRAPAAPQFSVGMVCQAKYSADGRFYRANIEDFQNGQYLVHYVDFGQDREWLPASSLK